MKKSLLAIVFLSLAQMVAAQGRFVLEGTADIHEGVVEVWRHEYECVRDSTDLIAQAEVKNGRFRIEADAPCAIVCRVYRTNKVGWYPVFLEPGITTRSNVRDKTYGKMVFEGGENQRIFNEFIDEHRKAYERYKIVLSEYGNDLDKNFDKIRPRANIILKELFRSLDEFFIRYHDKTAAAYVLYILSYGADIGNPDVGDLKMTLNRLSSTVRNNAYGKRVAETIRKMESNLLY